MRFKYTTQYNPQKETKVLPPLDLLPMRLRVLRLNRHWFAGRIFELGKISVWSENKGTNWMFFPGEPEPEKRLMTWLTDGVNGEFKKEKY